MIGYISIDHEILTKEGWKRVMSITETDLLYSLDGNYHKITNIIYIPNNNKPLFHIKNNHVNVFGTSGICMFNIDEPISLCKIYLEYNKYNNNNHIFKFDVLQYEKTNHLPVIKICNKKEIDNIVIDAIHNGYYVSVHQDISRVDYHDWYNIHIYSSNIYFDIFDNDSSILLINTTQGTSVIHFSLSQNVPVCIRRYNSISWIVMEDSYRNENSSVVDAT